LSMMATKHSPFEAMFGRKARLPIDINAEAMYDPDQKLKEFASEEEPKKSRVLPREEKWKSW